ncbi:hypothetical protein [Saccharospirillum mangrovi]|uniref:hypothetical protein n=1 Tax=Saccharospirillum mangrovi TaxID=2161747 RepID=UPI000D3A378A|nr:hypothetical protein [Saccharospirillum mangrovi]
MTQRPYRQTMRSRTAVASGLLLSAWLLTACNPGTPSDKAKDDLQTRGAAIALSDADYRALPAIEQYRVSNRLLMTLYRGVPMDEFFNLSNGLYPLRVKSTNYLGQVRTALKQDLTPTQRAAARARIGLNPDDSSTGSDDALYQFTTNTNDNSTVRHQQIPLAHINEFPLSRDLYVEWMAYFLTNTILFSPALEMESTDAKDAAFAYTFLRNRIRDGETVRGIVRAYLSTQSRWRVSRSAENHALEAYELYLGLFDTEEDSRRGGIACRDWRLTSEAAGYQLVRSGEENQTYQKVLDNYYVRTCDDLYDVIVSHPLFIPRMTEVIANYLLSNLPVEDRLAVVEAVVEAQPQTFEDIFTTLLFSKAYLLDAERPLWFEENFFGTLHRLHWSIARNNGVLGERILRDIQEYNGSTLYQGDMGSAAMTYKIGRTPEVPMDALSFASHAKAMREGMMVNNQAAWRGGDWDGATKGFKGLYLEAVPRDDDPNLFETQVRSDIAPLNAADFIDYLFLSTLMRPATLAEQNALMDLLDQDDRDRIRYDDDAGEYRVRDNAFYYNDVALVVMDYIARLPEFYYLVRPGEEINE